MRRRIIGVVVGVALVIGLAAFVRGCSPQSIGDSKTVGETFDEGSSGVPKRQAANGKKSWWRHSDLEPDIMKDEEPVTLRQNEEAEQVAPEAPPIPKARGQQGDEADDEGAGSTGPPVQKYAQTHTVVSLGPKAIDPTFGSKEDVAYDSGADAQFPADAASTIADAGKVNGAAGTVGFWLQSNWPVDQPREGNLLSVGDQLRVVKQSDSIRFEFTDSAGSGGIGAEVFDWQPGEWHYLMATWSGPQMTLFVDGEQIAQGLRDGTLDLPEKSSLQVGSSPGGDVSPPEATITDVRVYNRAIGWDEITARFRQLAAQASAK